jgi:hypothetical protein
LTTEADVGIAMPMVLQQLAEVEAWEAGLLWLNDEASDALQFIACWHDGFLDPAFMDSANRLTSYHAGQDPLGNVWSGVEREASYDLALDGRSPRAFMLSREGLRWAVYFPLRHARRVVGFLEFLSSEPPTPNAEQRHMIELASHHILQRMHQEWRSNDPPGLHRGRREGEPHWPMC